MGCQCGSENAYIDWWYNHRENRAETFVRCPDCRKIGESADTEAKAVMLWTDNANNDL